MVELAPDFDEFFACLIAHHVEFVVVGAYALAIHGVPRITGDIAVLIQPNQDNAERLIAALEDFGFPMSGLTAHEIIQPSRILQMGVPPMQIHVMSDISGVDWEEVWAGRIHEPCGRHRLPFIGRAEFLRNKRAAGRLKDLAAVEALEGPQS